LAACSGAEYFVASDAKGGGDGSAQAPWKIDFALSRRNGKPRSGDTVWVRGGTYDTGASGLTISLSSADPERPIVVRNYRNERTILQGAFDVRAVNLWLWGLEITDSPSSQPGYGLSEGGNLKLINCLIHNKGGSGGIGQQVRNAEFYGCVLLNVGSYDAQQKKCYGNTLYCQNRTAERNYILDNVVANGFLEGINIYSGGTTPINNFSVHGNIAFGNGHCGGRNLLVGSDIDCEGLLVANNVFYQPANANNITLCYGTGLARAPVFRHNIFNGGALFQGNLGRMEFVGNQMFGGEFTLRVPAGQDAAEYMFENNRFYGARVVGVKSPKDQFLNMPAEGTLVFLRTNRYERGRANLGVFNWAKAPTVDVDLSQVGLTNGEPFEVRVVQDYLGSRIVATNDGSALRLPMTGWPVMQPRKPRVAVPTTFPEFGAFVINPLRAAVELDRTGIANSQ
jgi:hypothetical protein